MKRLKNRQAKTLAETRPKGTDWTQVDAEAGADESVGVTRTYIAVDKEEPEYAEKVEGVVIVDDRNERILRKFEKSRKRLLAFVQGEKLSTLTLLKLAKRHRKLAKKALKHGIAIEN